MNVSVNNTSLAASAAVPLSLPTLKASQIGQGDDAGVVINTSAPHANNAAEVDGLDETAKVALSGWWSEQCQKVGFEWSKSQARGSTLRRQTIAMLSLEVALFPNTDWDARLTAMKIEPTKIRSKHKLAKAVAATFALDPTVAETKIARQAGKMIDRFALSVEWLSNQITAMSPAELKGVTFDNSGIDKLVAVLLSVGGVTRASDAQRAINNGTGKVLIDRFVGSKRLAERGKTALRKLEGLTVDADIPVSIAVMVAGKEVSLSIPQSLVDSIKDQVFEAAAVADPVVNMLGELVEVGSVVAHEERTKSAGSQGTDPEMTVGSRQFVLRPDRSILISSIASDDPSGPVVIARPVSSLVDPWPKGFCRLQNSGWHFAEANLVDVDRRKYFDASIKASANASCVATIELTTSVAGNGEVRSYGVDVLPIASGLANYPIEFALDKCSPEFEFAVTSVELQSWGEMLPSRVGNGLKPELESDGLLIKLNIGKTELCPSRQSRMKEGTVTFGPGYLLSVLRMMASLPLTDADVEFKADSMGGMHISFATATAAYELYIPAIDPDSKKPFKRDLQQIPVA